MPICLGCVVTVRGFQVVASNIEIEVLDRTIDDRAVHAHTAARARTSQGGRVVPRTGCAGSSYRERGDSPTMGLKLGQSPHPPRRMALFPPSPHPPHTPPAPPHPPPPPPAT